jgi:hypothetical protein
MAVNQASPEEGIPRIRPEMESQAQEECHFEEGTQIPAEKWNNCRGSQEGPETKGDALERISKGRKIH